MIGVLELGLGNPASVHNMFRTLGVATRSIVEPAAMMSCSGLVLPGVGHYDHGMSLLEPWADSLRGLASAGLPLLGICLGMQLLFDGSDEGERSGLGLLQGRMRMVSRARPGAAVPHVGWADVQPLSANLLLPESAEFYFTHSYCLEGDVDPTVAVCQYDQKPFSAVVARGSVWGVQFHPEKSHRFGKELLRRFSEDVCRVEG